MIAALAPRLNLPKRTELHCRACGWTWKSRVPSPVKCASCAQVGTFFPLKTPNAATLAALPGQEVTSHVGQA